MSLVNPLGVNLRSGVGFSGCRAAACPRRGDSANAYGPTTGMRNSNRKEPSTVRRVPFVANEKTPHARGRRRSCFHSLSRGLSTIPQGWYLRCAYSVETVCARRWTSFPAPESSLHSRFSRGGDRDWGHTHDNADPLTCPGRRRTCTGSVCRVTLTLVRWASRVSAFFVIFRNFSAFLGKYSFVSHRAFLVVPIRWRTIVLVARRLLRAPRWPARRVASFLARRNFCKFHFFIGGFQAHSEPMRSIIATRYPFSLWHSERNSSRGVVFCARRYFGRFCSIFSFVRRLSSALGADAQHHCDTISVFAVAFGAKLLVRRRFLCAAAFWAILPDFLFWSEVLKRTGGRRGTSFRDVPCFFYGIRRGTR
ncbi:hypothetical protein PLICRDRAFT_478855 [Plicaturopsis crispa FD-325 SS-3]|nr:hypothetical protein PLICRDRAFT_478855 [Plicaturopsis crispa FD-325 SS-3]